jgi:hypothetical protein
VRTEKVLVVLVISGRGSEVPTGNAFAVVNAEDQVQVPLSPDRTLCHQLLPSAVSSFSSFDEFYQLALVRSVSFLRLVLAYHEYGPAEARSVVRATPPREIARRGHRPCKGESIFSMVRLSASADRLGRPPRAAGAGLGWVLTTQQEVSGHFKLQPHGPGGSLRKLIWVDAYERGSDGGPVKPRAVRL